MEQAAARRVVAQGERVSLAWFLPEDFDAVHAFASDPRVCRFMTWGPNSREDTRRFLAEVLEPIGDRYGLAVIVDDQVIGSAAVWVTDGAGRAGELGYTLSADAWGRGFATEAANLLLAIGRDLLGLARIAATCDVENHASARVLENIGMIREATLHSYKLVRGERRDHHLYARRVA